MSGAPKAGPPKAGLEGREIFFEITQLAENQRVCAVDAATGIEIITVLPATVNERDAQKIALKKLIWRLNQDQEEAVNAEEGDLMPPGKYV